jgi:Rrf2 family protein
MIRFSRDEDYSIILIHHLSKNYQKRHVPLSEVARTYKISIFYLRNLANTLVHANIIGAFEGKKGGYFLKKDPKKLKLGEIINTFSKKSALICCNKSICDKREFCDTLNEWRKLNENVYKQITALSFDDFIQYHRQ